MKTERNMKMGKYGLWSMAAFALLFAAACNRYDETGDQKTRPQGEPVEASFSLKVGSLTAGDEATYSLFQTDEPLTRTVPNGMVDDENALVKNLWVIQFEDGIAGDVAAKKMVGVPRFISSSDLVGHDGTVQLIGTTNPCYIIWIANHPLGADFRWNLPLNATFADVAAKMMQISTESDTWPEIDGTPTIMMNAITETPVVDLSGEADLKPVFSRNYARVSLKLTMGAAGYKILSVRLRNVPVSITLSELALGPAYSNIVPANDTIYPYGSPMIDYPAVAPASGELDDLNLSKTFTWYVPRNQQGKSISTSSDYKNYYAPNNATYFEVIAQRTDNPETAVFRVYPGANQKDDYILLPNHAYTSSLLVKGIGSSATPDSRIDNFDDVGYTESEAANCYILNPAPAGGRTRKYSIPITHAVTYWSENLAGYGNDPNNVIKDGDVWQISVLWSDDYDSSRQITFDNSGAGTGPNGRFTLNVPAGLPPCNFTVKLTRSGSDVILWSWHFWVTDYNPDAFRFFAIDHDTVYHAEVPAGTFTYPVPNGQVERYAGTVWTTGSYANRVMMDRPLGAVENYFTELPVSTNSHTTTTRGHLFYQFGRKDPFPLVSATAGVAQLSYGSIRFRLSSETGYNDPVPQVQSVLNPSLYYTKVSAGTWCSDVDGYTSPYYVWHDPKAIITSVGLGMENVTKSIHDPCPPGWKVPVRGAYSDFTLELTANYAPRDIGWDGGRGVSELKALRYWPGTTKTAPTGGRIFFAASGYRVGASGNVSNVGTGAYSWLGTPYSTSSGYAMTSTSGALNPVAGPHRSLGHPVRCVSE